MASKARKRKYVKGKPLHISVRVQQLYSEQIQQLVERMTAETKKEIATLAAKPYVTEHFTTDSVGMDALGVGSQTRILMNALKNKYDQLFGKLAFGLSPWMADEINRNSANAVNGAAKDMPNLKDESKKLSLDVRQLTPKTKQIIKNAAAWSTDFIKTIPERFLNTVSSEVYKSIAVGNGLQDLVPFLEKQGSSIKNWAHNTAMDQTRKTFNQSNLQRMRNIGITKGEWLHSGGSQHPRPLHEEFDGKTFDLSIGAPVGDDGEDVMPGEEPNCRCTFSPVVMYDEDLEAQEDD